MLSMPAALRARSIKVWQAAWADEASLSTEAMISSFTISVRPSVQSNTWSLVFR